MENKVYVIKCSSGYYDDYETWLVGVFSDKEKAESVVENIKKEISKIREKLLSKEELEKLSENEEDKYDRWYLKNVKVIEQEEPVIEEFILNNYD